MPLKDFLDKYNFNADEFDFDAFKASALEEFNKDEGIFNAKITQLTEDGSRAAQELRDQKVKNYDLLQRIPGENTSEQGTPEPEKESDITVGDLFGTPKKE